MDLGASHNVTADFNNLNLHQDYNELDDIVIGDGTGLKITHIGSTNLSTPSNKFLLSNVLFVPSMKKKKSYFCISILQIKSCFHWIFSISFCCEGHAHEDTTNLKT